MIYNKHKKRSQKTRKFRLQAAIHFLNQQPPLVALRGLSYGSFGYY